MRYEEAWRFDTERFSIRLEVAPEDMAYDGDDEDGEIARKIEDGTYAWFCARLSVYLDGNRIAEDHLGGCCYNSVREFYTSHRDRDPMNRNCSVMRAANGGNVSIGHYFPDMVSTAIAEARKMLGNVPKMRA